MTTAYLFKFAHFGDPLPASSNVKLLQYNRSSLLRSQLAIKARAFAHIYVSL